MEEEIEKKIKMRLYRVTYTYPVVCSCGVSCEQDDCENIEYKDVSVVAFNVREAIEKIEENSLNTVIQVELDSNDLIL